MLASSNLFFLIFLAVVLSWVMLCLLNNGKANRSQFYAYEPETSGEFLVSWVMLCLLNNGTANHSQFYAQEPEKTRDYAKQWTRRLLSIVFAKNPNLVVYLICTLLGVFLLYNVITRKVKAVALIAANNANNEEQTNLLAEISHLKEENLTLLKTLNELKIEKKMFSQHIKLNASLIRKLRAEHAILKEKHEELKSKILEMSNEKEKCERKSSTSSVCSEKSPSSAYIINHFFGKNKNLAYVDMTLTPSNHDTINRILREAYQKHNGYDMFDGKQPEIKTLITCPTSEDCNVYSLKDLQNINIVSTDQLEKIKGLAASNLSINCSYPSNDQIYEEIMRRKMEKII